MPLSIRIAVTIDFGKSWTYNLCALYCGCIRVVAKTQRLETRTLHAVPIKMHLEKSIGIILMMYNELQLNAAAISSSGGKWVKQPPDHCRHTCMFSIMTKAVDASRITGY